MKTQLLLPIVNSPFSHDFDSLPDSVPDSLHESLVLSHPTPMIHPRSSIDDVVYRTLQPSSASLGSLAIAPAPTNQENAGIASQLAVLPLSLLSIDSQDRDTCQPRQAFAAPQTPASINSTSCDDRKRYPSEPKKDGNTLLQNAMQNMDKSRVSEGVSSGFQTLPARQIPSPIASAIADSCKLLVDRSSSHPSLGSTQEGAQPSQPGALPRGDFASDSPIIDRSVFWQPRLSTNSSGVVHTVKTTSFSIGSFSALSRSLRLGRSDDTRGLISSHSRFSSDSERPPTTSSIDEAAIRRAVKRRQVLDEIVSTEESYITDLRALVYLMSTLLASGTSLPNTIRASVQQNVLDLLHLHEAILDKCHRAALKSAARKWADTLPRRRLRSPRRFRRLEAIVVNQTNQTQRRIRSSIDSYEFTKVRVHVNGAEATDIGDLVGPFSSLVTSFLSYEEYTANHGLIAHDLQRHMPALWSTYGSGMESLARSVVSLDRRESDSKKEGPSKFEIVALIKLCDLKIESPMDGKGLQCPSALHTWKVCFSVGGNLYELVLSACSATEEEQWTKGLRGELDTNLKAESQTVNPTTTLTLELKSVGAIYSHQGTLARRLSIQRAATVGNRVSICQVIVRNTNSPEELHDFRPPWTSAINRSQSHLSANRIVVLAPKRSERVRLEASLSDIWTKDKLPYPGMLASRGGQIIRASAGSLVRKLSFASIHAPFSRRSASLTLSTQSKEGNNDEAAHACHIVARLSG
ncbi:hypothetical protein DV736_g5238, partial [Chaetothyriales sp. CBS 134916]